MSSTEECGKFMWPAYGVLPFRKTRLRLPAGSPAGRQMKPLAAIALLSVVALPVAQALRGIERPQELFTLDQFWAG